MINRPGEAGAVIQSPPLMFIIFLNNSLIDPLPICHLRPLDALQSTGLCGKEGALPPVQAKQFRELSAARLPIDKKKIVLSLRLLLS